MRMPNSTHKRVHCMIFYHIDQCIHEGRTISPTLPFVSGKWMPLGVEIYRMKVGHLILSENKFQPDSNFSHDETDETNPPT